VKNWKRQGFLNRTWYWQMNSLDWTVLTGTTSDPAPLEFDPMTDTRLEPTTESDSWRLLRLHVTSDQSPIRGNSLLR
jgi:hypothetical protein